LDRTHGTDSLLFFVALYYIFSIVCLSFSGKVVSLGAMYFVCMYVYALYKAYRGERAWEEIGDRLERPHYLSRVDHSQKIRNRRQRTHIGKYSFVNRTIEQWNQLPAQILEPLPCNSTIFRKRVRKMISEEL